MGKLGGNGFEKLGPSLLKADKNERRKMSFELWFAEAREILNDKGRLPLLGQFRFDMIDALDDAKHEAWQEPDRFMTGIPAHDPSDPAKRAVVLAFYAALLDYKLFLDADEEAKVRQRVAHVLRDAVELLPPVDCQEPWQAHWEIAAAGVSGAWNRVPALADRWTVMDSTAAVKAAADAARCLFLSVHPMFAGPAADTDVRVWVASFDPASQSDDERGYSALYNYITYRAALLQRPTAPLRERWFEPEQMTAEMAERLSNALAFVDRIEPRNSLTLTMQAASAWCAYAKGVRSGERGLLRLAAERYLELTPHPEGGDRSDDAQRIFSCASACSERAEDLDQAEKTLECWTDKYPADPEAWRRLAAVRGRLGSYEAAFEAFETSVRLSSEADADWQTTLLLKFGLELKATQSGSVSVRSATPAFGAALLEWTWPQFSRLSPKTQERWWAGLANVCVPEVAYAVGPAYRGLAGACFGEAVVAELRTWVVEPLAAHLEGQQHWRKVSDEAAGLERSIAKGLERRTLLLRPTDQAVSDGENVEDAAGGRHRALDSSQPRPPAPRSYFAAPVGGGRRPD